MLCHSPVFNGMFGAMVIAGETCKARAVVTPLWNVVYKHNVACWAWGGAQAAADTFFRGYMERFVGYHVLCEKAADNPAVDFRPPSDCQFFNVFLFFDNQPRKPFKVGRRFVFLLFLVFWSVYVHKWQPDVWFRHDKRERAVKMYVFWCKIAL